MIVDNKPAFVHRGHEAGLHIPKSEETHEGQRQNNAEHQQWSPQQPRHEPPVQRMNSAGQSTAIIKFGVLCRKEPGSYDGQCYPGAGDEAAQRQLAVLSPPT